MPNLLPYTTQDKKVKVELYKLSESVFLAQDAMAKLFAFARLHLKKLRFDLKTKYKFAYKKYPARGFSM